MPENMRTHSRPPVRQLLPSIENGSDRVTPARQHGARVVGGYAGHDWIDLNSSQYGPMKFIFKMENFITLDDTDASLFQIGINRDEVL
jgi:hypothetical protein